MDNQSVKKPLRKLQEEIKDMKAKAKVHLIEQTNKLKKLENKAYKGRSAGPGGITFVYGDGTREAVTHHSFIPKAGDMYIFPAWLKQIGRASCRERV